MEDETRNHLKMLGARRAANNAAFKQKLQEMALPLAPLVQLTTGDVHPAFPCTLLNFWLLTDSQLEELAHFYHQRTPSRYTFHYPCPINVSSPPRPYQHSSCRRMGETFTNILSLTVVFRHVPRGETSQNRPFHRASRLRNAYPLTDRRRTHGRRAARKVSGGG